MHAWPQERSTFGHGTSQRGRLQGSRQRSVHAECMQRTRHGSTQGGHGAAHLALHLLCSQRVSHVAVHGGHRMWHGCVALHLWPHMPMRVHRCWHGACLAVVSPAVAVAVADAAAAAVAAAVEHFPHVELHAWPQGSRAPHGAGHDAGGGAEHGQTASWPAAHDGTARFTSVTQADGHGSLHKPVQGCPQVAANGMRLHLSAHACE